MIPRIGIVLLIGLLGIGGAALYQQSHRTHLVSATYAAPEAGMVFVPAGRFVMGSDATGAGADEKPAREVFVPAFYIDVYEVTNAQFNDFDPEHTFDSGKDH